MASKRSGKSSKRNEQTIGPGESQADPQGDRSQAEDIQNLNRRIPTQSSNSSASGGGGTQRPDFEKDRGPGHGE